MSDSIDHAVGLEIVVKLGDGVKASQPIMRLFSPPEKYEKVARSLLNAITIADEPPVVNPLIVERIRASPV